MYIPETRRTSNKKLTMYSSQEKKRSAVGKPVLPVGENKPGLNPTIPFSCCEPKQVDEDYDDNYEMVNILVMIDPARGTHCQEIDVKTFPGIKNDMYLTSTESLDVTPA